MKKMIRKNIKYLIGILVILGALFCLINRKTNLTTQIVSNPDTQISFDTAQGVLEQTWQPQVKELTGVIVPYTAEDNFSAQIKIELCSDNGEVLTEGTVTKNFSMGENGNLEFDFGEQKVIPGERYRIRLEITETDATGRLLIPAGSNYGGCDIEGKEQNAAAALTILFEKNSRLFWLVLIFFPLVSFSLLLYVLYGKKWEETVGLSLLSEILILYIFGLFNQLKTGITFIYIASVLCLIYAVWGMVRRRISLTGWFSKGILIYGILFILICINCRGAFFARWDEYSHWGLAVRDMFYYDSFAKHINTTVMLTRYVPFSTLAEYLFVYLNGLFSEEIVYVAYQVCLLSLGCVIFSGIRKNGWRVAAAGAVMVLVPVIFFGDAYNSIYVDPLLAALAGYVLYCYLSDDMNSFNFMRIVTGICALVLTKDMGLVIAGLLVGIMVVDTIYRQVKVKEKNKKEYFLEGLLLVVTVAVFFSWQTFLAAPMQDSSVTESITAAETVEATEETPAETEVTEKKVNSATISASGLSFTGIMELLKGEAPDYRYQSIKNCLIEMFDGEVFGSGVLKVSYVNFWILLLIAVGGLTFVKRYAKDVKRILFITEVATAGGIVYCLFLELLYLFAFPPVEALQLASFSRYLGSYTCGILFAVFGMILVIDDKESEKNRPVLPVCLLAGIIMATPMSAFVIKNMDFEIAADDVYWADGIEELLRSFARRGEKVYFVCNNSNGCAPLMFRSFACPVQVSDGPYNFLGSKDSVKEQMERPVNEDESLKGNTQILTKEEWNTKLGECNYVFLLHPDPLFVRDYYDLFAEPETVDDGTFYRIKQDQNGNCLLEYVGKVGIKTYK